MPRDFDAERKPNADRLAALAAENGVSTHDLHDAPERVAYRLWCLAEAYPSLGAACRAGWKAWDLAWLSETYSPHWQNQPPAPTEGE